MFSLSRLRTLILGCALFVTLVSAGSSRGQGMGSNDVEFKTFDGVKLSGKLYAGVGGKGKPDATVLLIPNFDLKKGGGIQQEGYDTLAKGLQSEGYTVLSFDFRGFGDSKTVDPVVFWKQNHNLTNVKSKRVGGKLAAAIDHKDFITNYVQYFVNDIAAAKAFLDQENDNKSCNSSNVVVIGAGYGATLGAMWVANECRRRKDLAILGGVPMLGDIEAEDIAGAVWLSLQPSLPGGKNVPLTKWIVEGGRANKIPMAFIHGKNDSVAGKVAANMSEAIKGKGGKPKDFEFTGAKVIDETKLVGNQLLQPALGTQTWILEKYLAPVMAKRTMKRRTDRKVEMSRFYYTRPTGAIIRVNKPAGAKVPSVDTALMLSP